jgi:hypothetical protein
MHPVKAQQLVEGGSPNLIIQDDPQWHKKTSNTLPKGFLQKHSHAQQDNQEWSMYSSALIQ